MTGTNQAAGTAYGPMAIAATEQFLPANRRIVDDPLAYSALGGATRFFTHLCRWEPIRRYFFKLTESKGPGVWGGTLGRKRYIDDKVAEALKTDIRALVILGAGLDTRGCRIAAPAGVPSFEIDLPQNIAAKKKALGTLPDTVHLVPVDFETADLDEVLAANGYDRAMKTFFIWEGVTQYLTKPAIDKTFDFLSHAAIGSRLAFTFVLMDFIAGTNMHGAANLYERFVTGSQLWKTGMAPQRLGETLEAHGWRLIEHVGGEDYRERYFAPARRDMSVMEIERTAFAEKVR